MKKKKILFASLLLLIIVVPFTIIFGNVDLKSGISLNKLAGFVSSASRDPNYRYSNWGVSANRVYGSKLPGFCVNSNACHSSSSTFWIHEAMHYSNGAPDRIYHSYCLHIGKKSDGTGRPDLTAYTYSEGFNSGDIKNAHGSSLSDSQLELLQDFLASGYQWDKTNSTTVYKNTSQTDEKKIFVKQVIVWEIIEGGRTSFGSDDNPAPNVYNNSNSAYRAVVSNKSDLLSYYKQELKAAREYRDKRTAGSTAPVFGKTYTMTWDRSIGKYSTGSLSGLGGFNGCTVNNSNATVSTNGDTITVVSSVPISSATVKCSYTVGNGSGNQWVYYKYTNHSDWQDLIRGVGGSTIEKTFTIRSEESSVRIVKINSDRQAVPDTKFTLILNSDPSVKYDLEGNKEAKVINKSGDYTLSETIPAHGYQGIPEVVISIDLQNKTIRSNNTNYVAVAYDIESNEFRLTVVNYTKDFEIKKQDESGQPLKGATFKVYKGSNFTDQVKFNKNNNKFIYSESGSVIDIVDSNYSSYSIQLLPVGIYKIVETAAPSPYILATAEADRTYYIKVTQGYDIFDCGKDRNCSNPKLTVQNSLIVKNYKTKVIINKIGNGGVPLQGVKFVLLDSTKSKYINSTGNYNYSGISNSLDSATIYVTNASGNIVINNIPVGTYYAKEIETIDPYILPEGDAAYTQLVVEMNASGPRVNGKVSLEESISNATKQFNFYKVDENGNYLSGGKFKIQKYNEETNKFDDIKITAVTNDGTYQREANIFKEDENGKVQFTLAHGIATFVDMRPNTTYRIVELEAPKGYQVANVDNGAIIKIDRNGYAKGSATIINQKKTLEGSTAQAELVIEIQTGQKVTKYGLIIGGTLIVIAGLMVGLVYVSKKRK